MFLPLKNSTIHELCVDTNQAKGGTRFVEIDNELWKWDEALMLSPRQPYGGLSELVVSSIMPLLPMSDCISSRLSEA
jgi:hypothetical protein